MRITGFPLQAVMLHWPVYIFLCPFRNGTCTKFQLIARTEMRIQQLSAVAPVDLSVGAHIFFSCPASGIYPPVTTI